MSADWESGWDKVIAELESLLPLLPKVPPEHQVKVRSDLSQAYLAKFAQFRRPENLQEAIKHGGALLRVLPRSDAGRSIHLNGLSYMKMSRYGVTNSLQDLYNAVALASQAKAESPAGNPELPNILNNLGFAFSTRYDRLGNLSDLNEAIRCAREAIQLSSPGSLGYKMNLRNLSSRLCRKF